MKGMIAEYRQSLKNPKAEEFLDIYFFRPMAFVIVKALYQTSLTPNMYSLLAFVAGVGCAVGMYLGTPSSYQWAAACFFLFAVIDCCDGMLARLKKNGSELGRIIDGVVDWSTNIFTYVAMAVGFHHSHQHETFWGMPFWVWAVVAGFSKAVHSAAYDFHLMNYMALTKGENYLAHEREKTHRDLREAHSAIKRLALRIYAFYLWLQSAQKETNPQHEGALERKLTSLRLWGAIGPAPHILLLVVAFAFSMPALLFLYAGVFGNLWYLALILLQKTDVLI